MPDLIKLHFYHDVVVWRAILQCALAEATADQKKQLSDIAEIAAVAVQIAPVRANRGRHSTRYGHDAEPVVAEPVVAVDENIDFAELSGEDSVSSAGSASDDYSDDEVEPLFLSLIHILTLPTKRIV